MDKRHWKDGPLSLTQGNMVQRTIFTNERSPGIGAVLRYIDHFAWGYLEGSQPSAPQVNEGVQEVFFVTGGSGRLITPDQEHPIQMGDGILLPPQVEYSFTNEGDIRLEFLRVVETIPLNAAAQQTAPLVRNYQTSPLSISHWSYIVHPIFGPEDGLVQLRDVLVVSIDPLQTGDQHGHGPDMDEVWYMWQGQAIHVVSQEVCVQTAGTAVSVCPCHPGHSLINPTDEPVHLFYFCSLDHNV